MNTSKSPPGCCSVLELRQYTLKAGQRDVLIDLFERYFVESQEAAGMTLAGQFRDRRRDDRFVWLRGFASMECRHRALETFYGGAVWAAHRDAANSTMVDSSDVLLLKPARPGLGFQVTPAVAGVASDRSGPLTVLVGIHQLSGPADAATLSRFEQRARPILEVKRVRIEGVYVTESAPNTFTRLPVREGENVLVWVGTIADSDVSGSIVERLTGLLTLENQPVSILELEPTSRSLLGSGRNAARASKHDFDFLFGSWKIHNRFLQTRLGHSTEWTEFEARSHTEPLLDGFGHLDRYNAVQNGESFEGITLRLFNPATGEWEIHWADTARARTLLPPMIGRFCGGVGEFYGDETVDTRKVTCRFRWTKTTNGSPQWEQAFSDDGGETWETNWIMTFTRP